MKEDDRWRRRGWASRIGVPNPCSDVGVEIGHELHSIWRRLVRFTRIQAAPDLSDFAIALNFLFSVM